MIDYVTQIRVKRSHNFEGKTHTHFPPVWINVFFLREVRAHVQVCEGKQFEQELCTHLVN